MPRIYDAVNSEPFAIIVRCPDRRFRKAHRGFIEEELGLKGENFWPLKPAGGPAALAHSVQMKEQFVSLTADIELFVAHSTIKHIILISHEDCRRYDKLVNRNRVIEPEKSDLVVAIRILQRKYPNIEISAYYARFTDETHEHIYFESVQESCLRQELQLA